MFRISDTMRAVAHFIFGDPGYTRRGTEPGAGVMRAQARLAAERAATAERMKDAKPQRETRQQRRARERMEAREEGRDRHWSSLDACLKVSGKAPKSLRGQAFAHGLAGRRA